MNRKNQERLIQFFLVVTTVVMTILRIILNEKGRVNPDSIRFMRFANGLPVIDNTVTPTGYPAAIKFFTFFGFDEFWSTKIIGILAYAFIIFFAWKKKFYFKESIIIGGLFSYLSIFSFSLSETLILPVVFVFLYVSRNTILGIYKKGHAVLLLSLILILLYNIRYSALFFMGTCFLYGLLSYRKKYGKAFLISGLIGFAFVVLYKFTFIDYFNKDYVNQFLEIGLYSTSKLLTELFQGLATSFNPFIHIANPGGGIINIGIYGIGVFNILLMIFLFVKNGLTETEKYCILVGICGIACSFFIQYFYSVNPLDYRLLTPFILSVWMVYFKKLFALFGKWTYSIAVLSLATGFVFTWLSRGDYLANRKEVKKFLKEQNIEHKQILFYAADEKNLDEMQVAELISTVNPRIHMTYKPQDTLKKETLTEYRVLQKMKIIKNKYQ